MLGPDCGDVVAGRYRLIALLGEGGLSKVYLAADLKLSGKQWAVKITEGRGEYGTGAEEEARILTALNHPRLPTIVDYVYDSSADCSFLVMEYVDGQHLDRYVHGLKNRLSHDRLALLGMQICEGLAYLHRQDPPIIHRDLKPSNLLIDASGGVRFIDFGISRRYCQGREEDTVKLGTIGFAAPEQYGGSQSDARSDLYSLGAVLLYLGTEGKYTCWCKEAESILLRRGFSCLCPVLSKLLEQAPEHRYSSAEETYTSLKSIVTGERRKASGMGGRPTDGNPISHLHRPVVISVMSAFPGAGSTHTSIMLAHVLARYGFRVAMVESDCKSSAFQEIAKIAEEEGVLYPSGEGIHNFRLEEVDYLRVPSRAERLGLLNGKYDCIVYDQGSSRRKEDLEEFARADLALWVEGAGAWRRTEPIGTEFWTLHDKRGLICIVPFASEGSMKRIRKFRSPCLVFSMPADDSPFCPGELAHKAIVGILGQLFPHLITEVKSPRGFARMRKYWKGRM